MKPRNETTAVERDKIITAIQHLVEEFGGADKALIAANRTPTPRRLKKTSKFVKRALRILIRTDKGLEIHAKRG